MRYIAGGLISLALIVGCDQIPPAPEALQDKGMRAPSQPLPPEYRNATAIYPRMPKNVVLALLSERGIAVHPAMLQVAGETVEWPPAGFELNGANFVLSFSLPDKNGSQELTSITWLRTIDEAAPASKTNRQWVTMQELELPAR